MNWWFVFKFNSQTYPDCGGAQRTCLFGGTVQPYKSYGQQFAFASSLDGTLRQGGGCVGDTTTDPLGATFAQVYNGNFYYVLWNDQFYDDPKIEKLRNWFCYREYSGDFIVEQDCHNFDVLHWFLNSPPIRVTGYGGRKVRTTMDLLDHLSIVFEFPGGLHVNYEANQLTPRGFGRIGEEFTGTKGGILTSRSKMVHVKGPKEQETIASKRDITIDAFEAFLGRILSGDVENVAERSAISTLFAILGRTAIYTGKEAVWKDVVNL